MRKWIDWKIAAEYDINKRENIVMTYIAAVKLFLPKSKRM